MKITMNLIYKLLRGSILATVAIVIFQLAYSVSLISLYNKKIESLSSQTLYFITEQMPDGVMPIRGEYTGVPYQVENLILNFNEQAQRQFLPIRIFEISTIKANVDVSQLDTKIYKVKIEKREYEVILATNKLSLTHHIDVFWLVFVFLMVLLLYVFMSRYPKTNSENM